MATVYTKAATITDIGMTFAQALLTKLVEDGVVSTTCSPDELAAACAEAGKAIVVSFGTAPRKARVPCNHPGCSTRPNYGMSGETATKCAAHKEEGMVNVTIEKRTKALQADQSDEAHSADEEKQVEKQVTTLQAEKQATTLQAEEVKTPKKRAPRKAE